jgi:hypothetical protein
MIWYYEASTSAVNTYNQAQPLTATLLAGTPGVGNSPTGKRSGYWDFSREMPFGATITKLVANVTDTATASYSGSSDWDGGNITIALVSVDSAGNETVIASAESGAAFNSGNKDLTLDNLALIIDGSATLRFKAYVETHGYWGQTMSRNGVQSLNSVIITFSY